MARSGDFNTPDFKRRKIDSAKGKEEAAVEAQQQKITDILDRHDSKVRLLFHLEKFVSLVNYEPEAAKQDKSQVFEEYQQQYDLWSKITDESNNNRAGRRSTRRQIRQQQVTAGIDTPEPSPKQSARSNSSDQGNLSSSAATSTNAQPTNKSTPSRGSQRQKHKQQSKGRKRKLREEEEQDDDDEDYDGVPVGTEVEVSASGEITVAHPNHVPPKPEFGGSLDAFLGSFVALDEFVTEEQRDQTIEETVEIRRKLADAKRRGILTEESASQSPAAADVKRFADPIKKDTFQTNLIRQALHFSKLLSDERKSHLSQARKVSREVDHYFKRLEGAEERLRKEQERRLRQLAKKTSQDVAKKWKMAEQVVLRRHAKIREEEQRQQGKQRMNEMLENSVKLLESRIPMDEEELERELEEEENEDSSKSDPDDSMASDEMSSSDEEENEDGAGGKDEDENDASLTVEELRAKYAALENLELGSDSDDEDDQNDDQDDQDDNEKESERNLESREEDQSESKEADDEEPGSDISIEMDSENEDSEDSDDEDEDEDEEEGDEDGGAQNTLASLFGGVKPKVQQSATELDDASGENGHAKQESVAEQEPERLENGDRDGPEDGDQEHEKEVVNGSSNDAAPEENQHDVEEIDRKTNDDGSIHLEVPFLLRGNLRQYQHDGLDWLAGLYNSGTNGILADEMGLGKTIQTIALISHLACEKHIWGPHLIVVPTSVMLNWEMEFKRFAPGFKVMTYYGNPQQRKEKRRGWNKEDVWHVCITSYQLVLQDQPAFRRKKWHYMILDEAHNIKNFRSQRWQALLNFNSERRLLLTGTPLQNNLVELWSLLYFLMPSSQGTVMMPEGFANLQDFQDWFARPVDKMVEEGGHHQDADADNETRETVSKLHHILRPYLLRRIKADVEKQMPGKYEHIVYCRLSKRQRYLYDDFMSRAQTRETLASGNYLSIINCLMQLRKVCNHPDLFEVRPIVTSMACNRSVISDFTTTDFLVRKKFLEDQDSKVDLSVLGLNKITSHELELSTHEAVAGLHYTAHNTMLKELKTVLFETKNNKMEPDFVTEGRHAKYMEWVNERARASKLEQTLYVNRFRAVQKPVYGRNVISMLTMQKPPKHETWDLVCLPEDLNVGYKRREEQMSEVIDKYSFVTPNVVCLDRAGLELGEQLPEQLETHREDELFHKSQVKLTIAFPDKRLLQYDCGKLQRLALLMRDLIDEGHRALIFTQMTKVLDILEQFLNIHGWRYLRLDGATKIEERQVLTERFNNDNRIPVFILSTRSGGLGINLTGADTVIFYDNDWNPSMDKQCQDRCHRIGQTRDVHIYRFVSEYTIESNILKKATQKQILDNVVIQDGDFTTDYLQKLSVKDMLGDDLVGTLDDSKKNKVLDEKLLTQAEEDQDDANAARVAMKEVNLDQEEFGAGTATSASGTAAATTRATTVEPESGRGEEQQEEHGGNEEEEEEDDGIGHIDDYMIRFIERGDYY